MESKIPLLSLNKVQLTKYLEEMGQKSYRVTQILEWLYKKRCSSISEMSNLSAELRARMEERFSLSPLLITDISGAKDTTQKYLFRLHDGRYVESVLIPANIGERGDQSNRRTICVSSQVGCAYGCKFCASGLAGFTRNLTSDEIIGQCMAIEQATGEPINNIVFMGMGEPLANFSNLTVALEIITAHWGLNIGARHINVSTSGLAPQIKKLADFPAPIRLAISLHGATDEVRDKIMPVNRKYNIEKLFEALQYWKSKKKQKITLEYILIKGVNDSLEQATILAKRAKQLQAKINLIPYNTVEGLDWIRPSDSQCRKFQQRVKDCGIPAFLRIEKGHDINAACGQLRLKKETAEGIIEAPVKARRA